jgi:DNA polymerase III subunit gamma/tau
MSYQVLARKYRPQHFSEVIGQEHVTRTLKNAIEQGRIAHGYIFSGHRGIGKTTVARILAMALNCRSADHPVPEPCGKCDSCTEIRAGNSVDVIEIDAATNRGIDEIRELRDAARYRPARDRYKVWILDEAHQITDAAFNALLKTLEEPPGHVVFMLATTQPEDIPQTIRSRCQHFSFHAVRFDQILAQLRELANREGIAFDEDALALLAEAGDGSVRDALSLLDQAIASSGSRLTTEIVRQLAGTAPSDALEHAMQAVERSASDDLLRLIDKLITEGHSPTHFARQLVRFLRNAVVAKVAGTESHLLQISPGERDRVGRVAALFSEEELARFLQIMLRTHSELSYRQEQRLHLELGLLKMAHARRLLPIEQLLSEAGGVEGGRAKTAAAPRSEAAKAVEPSAGTSAARVSPFAADTARKNSPRMIAEEPAAASVAVTGALPVISMGAAAPALATLVIDEVAPSASPVAQCDMDSLRSAVLHALESAGHRMLSSMLEVGDWELTGAELLIKAAVSNGVAELAFGAEPKRIATAAATQAAGRPLRVRVSGGSTGQQSPPSSRVGNGSVRSRAADDPIVRRMQEKFGAEIRTIIDHRDKR